jgi:hypothetical protein
MAKRYRSAPPRLGLTGCVIGLAEIMFLILLLIIFA